MYELVNKARKNDKGFSLVELIVVILIIAIIAIALAPQVMKYVGQSKTNVSENTAATLKSAVQAAVAEYQGQTGADAIEADAYAVAADSTVVQMEEGTNSAPSDSDKSLLTLIQDNVGNDELDGAYAVLIAASTGAVEVRSVSADTVAPSPGGNSSGDENQGTQNPGNDSPTTTPSTPSQDGSSSGGSNESSNTDDDFEYGSLLDKLWGWITGGKK